MIKIGLIGAGGMGNWHIKNFHKIKDVRVMAVCDVRRENAEAKAKENNIPAIYTDYREMLEKEELDGITNVTPDSMHKAVALAVLKKKIPLLSEKPLATNLADARVMARAAKDSKTLNMVNFSYRNSCALQEVAQRIKRGDIRRIIHVEASYLQSWLSSLVWGNWRTSPGWLWRLSTKHGSLGDIGDIGCHIYDMVTLQCGDIAEIFCRLKTFEKLSVKGQKLGEYKLDANDSFASDVVFKNGALGVIHSSRWATGHKNSLRTRVYGDEGAIEIDLDTSYTSYKICAGKNKDKGEWGCVEAKKTPTNYERFISCIKSGKRDPSDFENAEKIQAYLHYSFESAKKNAPVKVKF